MIYVKDLPPLSPTPRCPRFDAPDEEWVSFHEQMQLFIPLAIQRCNDLIKSGEDFLKECDKNEMLHSQNKL